MKCCCIAPPEPPVLMVNFGNPYCSTKCSLTIASVSAETTKLQPFPNVFRVPKATPKPRLSESWTSAEVTALRPERKAGPHPPPNGTCNLRFHPVPGRVPPADQGLLIGLVGSSRMEIR